MSECRLLPLSSTRRPWGQFRAANPFLHLRAPASCRRRRPRRRRSISLSRYKSKSVQVATRLRIPRAAAAFGALVGLPPRVSHKAARRTTERHTTRASHPTDRPTDRPMAASLAGWPTTRASASVGAAAAADSLSSRPASIRPSFCTARGLFPPGAGTE